MTGLTPRTEYREARRDRGASCALRISMSSALLACTLSSIIHTLRHIHSALSFDNCILSSLNIK